MYKKNQGIASRIEESTRFTRMLTHRHNTMLKFTENDYIWPPEQMIPNICPGCRLSCEWSTSDPVPDFSNCNCT